MGYSAQQQSFMKRCLDLAVHGAGNVSPNPMVGAVVVYKNRIIGEGFHEFFGGPHAEVNAVNSVSKSDLKYLSSSEFYVNLEPCSHFGKTPPCTDLILKKGFKKIFIANTDPNPLVAGSGIAKLKKAGCVVKTGLLETEGQFLNRRFFTFHTKHRPYIILKWAQSADCFFTKDNKQQHWITGNISRRLVHKWRGEEVAVMVGTNTARTDNPQLTNRLWSKGGKPVRIVLDKDLALKKSLNVFDRTAPTIVVTSQDQHHSKHMDYLTLPFDNSLIKNLLNRLYEKDFLSLIVEGGVQLLESFIQPGLWDEARVFTGPRRFISGIDAPRISGTELSSERIGEDHLLILLNS